MLYQMFAQIAGDLNAWLFQGGGEMSNQCLLKWVVARREDIIDFVRRP